MNKTNNFKITKVIHNPGHEAWHTILTNNLFF